MYGNLKKFNNFAIEKKYIKPYINKQKYDKKGKEN